MGSCVKILNIAAQIKVEEDSRKQQMVFLSNYWCYSKLYFRNLGIYIGTSISIVILVLHMYAASILLLYQHIN